MRGNILAEKTKTLCRKLLCCTALACAAGFMFCAAASAGVVGEIKKDLEPVSGYILARENGEYVVDLKKDQGVRAGDLLSVSGEGRELTHPETGESIGTLDEKKGILEVKRVKQDYSFAVPVSGQGFERGDRVTRYGGMPAVFRDYTKKGEELFARLRHELPDLEWQDYTEAEDEITKEETVNGPVFFLREDKLEVRGPELGLIRSYELKDYSREAQARGEPSLTERKRSTARGGKDLFLNHEGQADERILQADFTGRGGRVLAAATNGSEILIYEPEQGFEPVFKADTALPGQILWVTWWQPAQSEHLYLAVAAAVDDNRGYSREGGKKIDGTVFMWQKDRLTPVERGLDYLMAAFDTDGNGTAETLLAQKLDRDAFFGKTRQLVLKPDGIKDESPSFELPRRFPVLGATFADLSGDDTPEIAYIRNRKLFIHDKQGPVYESADNTGGSLNHLTYDLNPGMKDRLFNTVNLEIPPAAVDIDNDGTPELLAVSADTSGFSLSNMGTDVRKTRVSVTDFTDGGYESSPGTDFLERSIQGMGTANGKTWLVNTRGSENKGTSRFYTLEFK
ncbi:MAG: hypothetical protein ACLFQ9_07610 [Desulfobacterales bacterium]